MGKVSPNGRQPKTGRQKRQSRNAKNKYLKPGALAQLRNSKASASKLCTDLGKKRVAVLNAKQSGVIGSPDVFSQNNLQSTPKTPRAEEWESESRLESLPFDLLVIIARQFHFNYTTPDRTRQEMLNTMTPLPTDHWPFMSKGGGKGMWITSPHAPKAPKHGPRPPSRLKFTEMRQIAAVLFQESSFSKCLVPSVLQKPICKSLASNRVLFYEDELCQAVAQNKLR
ncbi:UNVERIFIED_CONTAM: F-box protein [Sesamum radiatum]|uniref:F-box protein n=1 Tax=Sesamum radiatum TaxID=300843 RepID=A0AAW2RG47_SESRA